MLLWCFLRVARCAMEQAVESYLINGADGLRGSSIFRPTLAPAASGCALTSVITRAPCACACSAVCIFWSGSIRVMRLLLHMRRTNEGVGSVVPVDKQSLQRRIASASMIAAACACAATKKKT